MGVGKHPAGASRWTTAGYTLWAFILVALGLHVLTLHTESKVVEGVPSITIPEPLTVLTVDQKGNRETKVLFSKGRTFAVAFVSDQCEFCQDNAAGIWSRLQAIEADERLVVSIVSKGDAESYLQRLEGRATKIGFPLAKQAILARRVHVVPSFVLTGEDGSVRNFVAGLPSHEAISQWNSSE